MSPIDPFDRHPASGATDCDGAAPARRWPRPLAGALTLLLALSLAACGGGGSNAADPLESATPYGAADAASPAGARDLPVDELRALVAGGTPVTWLQAGASDAAIAADQAAQAADEATLAASTDPQIAALRVRTLGVGDDMTLLPSGDRRFAIESPLGRESVVVHGDAWRRRELAAIAAALASRDNAIALYRQFRDPLPEGVLADLPPVDALGTLSDAEVQALVDRAAQRAVDVLSNESALPEEGAASSANGSRRLVQGRQQRLLAPSTSGCTHADEFSLYGEFDFALKNALSGVRSQGSRGTCAAFAVVAGLETQIRNTYGRAVDLSEQQLFAKAKGDWFPTVGAFGDGLPVSGVLQNLAAGALALRTETTWGYNAASSRVEIAAPPTGVYQNSCDGYGQACSDTNHEYGISCTTIGTVKYCARIDPTAGSTGENYRLLAWTNLWRSAPQLTTLAIRASLAAGQPVAIGVDVTYCLEKSSMWHQLDDGSWEQLVYRSYLSTDRYGCDPETSTGSHALLAVGYVSDAQMAARWTLPAGINVGEGGYYVIRNSWGCGSGDGGYLYISDRYLQQILHSAATVGPVAAAYGSVSLQYQTSVPVGSDGIIRTPATVTLKANANSLIKRVAFYQQGPLVVTQLGSSVDGNGTITHDLQLGAANSGDRVYFARGWDADNNLVSSNTVVVRVRIPGAPTVSLSASPSPISEGQTLTLTAAAASADGSGITQVQFMKGFTQLATVTAPPYATTVTLPRGETGNVGFAAVATNGNGFATTSAPLIVSVKSSAKPKIDAFTVSPTVIGAPQVVTLAWTVSGADTLTLTGNPGNTLDVTGKSSQQLYQTQAATFTLTAS
ncbi:MAG: C1 family peptidase, partial [Caldimonas sp.]